LAADLADLAPPAARVQDGQIVDLDGTATS
jgi:hypothetical protein